MSRIKYIIKVRMPDETKVFQTYQFVRREGRILFEDKYGQPKDFPQDDCFIEGVSE